MMKCKIFLAIITSMALLACSASAATMQVAVGSAQGGAGTTVTVPIMVSGASNLGAMDLQVSYDPAQLKLAGAQMGSISSGGVIEANEPQAGVALVSLIDPQGINGSGEVVKITFTVPNSMGTPVPLALQARAYDLDLKDIPVTSQGGTVTATPTKADIGTATILIALGMGIVFFGRRRD
jgi:hypothetical protein